MGCQYLNGPGYDWQRGSLDKGSFLLELKCLACVRLDCV